MSSIDLKPKIYLSYAEAPRGASLLEAYDTSVEELFFVRNPKWKKNKDGVEKALQDFKANTQIPECWVWYSWNNTLVHTVQENEYFELLTARNKNILNAEEQRAYHSLTVGIIGLSVGSVAMESLAVTGGPKSLRISDYDVVEISNLNRMKATLFDVGSNKALVTAKNLWSINPFLELDVWDTGTRNQLLHEFLTKKPALDVFIDEMDSLDLKIKARFICKQLKIPVLMATSNGDGIILDVERFDLEPDRQILHGQVPITSPDQLATLTYPEWLNMSLQIVGATNLTEKMQESLLSIGKSIASVPQLGTTVRVGAAALSFVLRRIAGKLDMPSGRYFISLEAAVIPNYTNEHTITIRKQKTEQFLNDFGK